MPVDILAAAPLRCLRAPDPALVLAPPPPPCLSGASDTSGVSGAGAYAMSGACLREHRRDGFSRLDLGDRHALAKLLLEDRADVHS